MNKVALIIVNWNGWNESKICLGSIHQYVRARSSTIEVVVYFVDNASTDGSVERVKKEFPKVHIIKNNENLGFSGGNNVGIRHGLKDGCSLFWFLNNDTYIESSSLRTLVRVFENDDIGIAGSKIYFTSGHEYHVGRYAEKDLGNVLWYAGGTVDWLNMYASHRGVDEVDHGQYEQLIDTDFVSGCSMLVRREVFEKVGLFDEKYYLYMEDLDLSFRTQRAGYRTVYVPDSRIWHDNASSSGSSGSKLHEYYQTRNRLLIGFRYAPLRTKFALFRESLRQMIRNNLVKRKAILDFYFGRFGKQYIQ